MTDRIAFGEALLEVIAPNLPDQSVRITELPFLIGRGADNGNHLQLFGKHVSRSAAAIVYENGYYLEDRGQRGGVFLNGTKIARHALRDGDVITFGRDEVHRVRFRAVSSVAAVESLLTQIDDIAHREPSRWDLGQINLLLEATMLLQSELPLDAVLGTMLNHSIAVTEAERGLLLEPAADGSLRVRTARCSDGLLIQPEAFSPSQTALRAAMERKSRIIAEDIREADPSMRGAESIVAQQLRAVIVIPLYATQNRSPEQSAAASEGKFLGVLYLDSRRPTAFSRTSRQILDAIAAEAASILQNARLLQQERQQKRLEQEVSIARDIQQALLPSGLRDFPHLAVTGTNWPCLGVGGDYFDVFSLNEHRTAFLIADVSGKGLGAALLTTMLQGALSGIRMGADPSGVFHHINSFLCEHSEVGRYATMFLGILDCEGHLEFINAGHPPPLLLRAGQVLEPFSEGCFPVGLLAEARYTTSSLKLKPQDVLVMFSDGVTEAENGEDCMFGVSRLRDLLLGKDTMPLEELQYTVLESVKEFSHSANQAHDITLLCVRYRPRSDSSRSTPADQNGTV